MLRSPLLIAIPSQDGRAVVDTLQALTNVAFHMNREIAFITPQASNIPRGRNLAMQMAAAMNPNPKDPLWMFWVDSDVRIEPFQEHYMADMIKFAEDNNAFVTGLYKMDDKNYVATMDIEGTKHLSGRLDMIKPNAAVKTTGFGFLYGPMPRTYTFHADRLGEDLKFWQENKHLKLYANTQVQLSHWKARWI